MGSGGGNVGSGDLCAEDPTSRAGRTHARICFLAERSARTWHEEEEEEEALHGGGTGFMCEWLGWHRLTTPFSRSPASVRHPPARWSRRFPREQSFAYLLNAPSIFPSPVRNSYTSAREHACNFVFRNASESLGTRKRIHPSFACDANIVGTNFVNRTKPWEKHGRD